MLRRILCVACMAAVLLAAGCGRAADVDRPDAAPASAEKPVVVTSFYPLYYFASQVAGDRVDLFSLVPAGVEPHDWEPGAADIRRLNAARVFIHNGAGMEGWVERTLASLDNGALLVVDSSRGLDLLPAGEHGEEAHEAHEPHEAADPHIWLDPLNAVHQVGLIRDALIQADPAGRAIYEANAANLIERLRGLDAEYQALAACPGSRDIVISHAFLAYPARRYGFRQVPMVASISPEAEPTPQQMADLVRFIKAGNLRYVFFETLVSDRVARVIADETGATALALNPIEGLTAEEEARGEDYFSLMRQNLAHLKRAMECQ